jgi:hypothetical protein
VVTLPAIASTPVRSDYPTRVFGSREA